MSSTPQTPPSLLAPLIERLRTLPGYTALDDSAAEALYGLAYHRLEQAHLEDAKRFFSALAFVKPTQAKYWRGLALTERLLTNYHAAAQLYKYIALLEPGNPQHELDLAECQLLLKDYGAARITFDALIASCGEDQKANAVLMRAKTLRELTPAHGVQSA